MKKVFPKTLLKTFKQKEKEDFLAIFLSFGYRHTELGTPTPKVRLKKFQTTAAVQPQCLRFSLNRKRKLFAKQHLQAAPLRSAERDARVQRASKISHNSALAELGYRSGRGAYPRPPAEKLVLFEKLGFGGVLAATQELAKTAKLVGTGLPDGPKTKVVDVLPDFAQSLSP